MERLKKVVQHQAVLVKLFERVMKWSVSKRLSVIKINSGALTAANPKRSGDFLLRPFRVYD